MVLPLPRRRTVEPVPLERRRTQASSLSPTGWLLLLVVSTFGAGLALAPVAYWWGYMAGQREADQEAVYSAIRDAIRGSGRVAALADTVKHLKRAMAAQAAQRLPQHVLDSLRNLRWSTP